MLKIAIFNLEDISKLQDTIDCLAKIKEEIIDAKIDLFIDKNNTQYLQNNPYINEIIPLDLNHINIFNFKSKYESVSYYSKNKYNIAVDTQGSFKSAIFNYSLTGKTAGFNQKGFLNIFLSRLYDEQVKLISQIEKKEKTKLLLSKTFGFEA